MEKKEKFKKIGKYVMYAVLLLFLVHVVTHFSYWKGIFDYWFKTDPSLMEVRVSYVIDGDTIIVTNEENKELRVRLLGIDTPESTNCEENACSEEGYAAAEYLRNLLETNEKVYLEYDERKYDQYGRELCYVWLSDNVDVHKYEDFEKYCVNALVLKNTYCKTLHYSPNDRYKDWFELIETKKA